MLEEQHLCLKIGFNKYTKRFLRELIGLRWRRQIQFGFAQLVHRLLEHFDYIVIVVAKVFVEFSLKCVQQ